jgi:hypothetical protein
MATKVVRILSHELHDGLGGVHKQGDVVELPAEVAYVAIGRHMAELVDSEAIIEHVRQAEEDMRARHLAEQQALSAKRMRLFDSLPPDVRARARELGEEAVDDYIATLLPKAEQPKRRRGRPPKARSADEDEKITGFRSSDGDH